MSCALTTALIWIHVVSDYICQASLLTGSRRSATRITDASRCRNHFHDIMANEAHARSRRWHDALSDDIFMSFEILMPARAGVFWSRPTGRRHMKLQWPVTLRKRQPVTHCPSSSYKHLPRSSIIYTNHENYEYSINIFSWHQCHEALPSALLVSPCYSIMPRRIIYSGTTTDIVMSLRKCSEYIFQYRSKFCCLAFRLK